MVEKRDLEQVDSFLAKVGKGSLFEYFKLGTTAPEDRLQRAVQKRREWAQGQQSNPKFRDEALWLIKNNNLVRRLLIDQRDAYVAFVASRVDEKALETLTIFIKGTLAAGVLTPDGESAIHTQGKALGLQPDGIQNCIDGLLKASGVKRAASPLPSAVIPDGDPWADDFTELAQFVDHYAILEVGADATLEEIEDAHRTRYRWARSLSDKRKSSEVYAQLDEAWRVLKDPDRRSAFDAIYRMRNPPEGEELFGDLLSGTFDPVAPPSDTSDIGPPPPPDLGASVAGSLGTSFKPSPSSPPPEDPEPTVRTLGFKVGERPRAGPSPGARKRAPTPPPEVKHTVGLGKTRTRRRGPRLALPGPSTVDLSVGRTPVRSGFAVKNAGGGRMRGRASSNKDWLEISPERLNADAEEQQIEVVVHPKLMPRNESVGLVTITTDQGDRETVTFRVQRSRVSSAEMALFAVLALLVVSVVHSLGWLPGLATLRSTAATAVVAPATLTINVDPGADAIFVEERVVGSGTTVTLREGLPLDQGFNVSVTLDGFGDMTERLTLAPGAEETLNLRLELSDPMDWEPDEESEAMALDTETLDRLMATRTDTLQACVAAARSAGNTDPAWVKATLYATNIGRFQGLRIEEKQNLVGDPVPCLRRQLRVLELPLLEGDYGEYLTTITAPGAGAE